MRKYIIIIILLMSGINCWAQTGNNEHFQKEELLSQFGTYFENIEMTEARTIRLQAKESFVLLSVEKKSAIIELILSKGYILAVIIYGHKQELWQKNTFGSAVLGDNWDLNKLYTPKSTLKTLQKTDVHPWFLYFGLNSSFNKDITNLNIASRIGFFLLKNRWDLALSYSFGISEGKFTNTLFDSDLGLTSRVYFPIKKYNISPYIGTGISYLWNRTGVYNETNYDYTYSSTSSWNIPLYLGISWYVGPGSLDVGVQLGDNSNLTIGYTFSF